MLRKLFHILSFISDSSIPFLTKAPRSQATKVICIKKSSWSIKMMFSSATLVGRWGLQQQWCRKRLQGLKSNEGHEEPLGFPPLTVPFAYHPNIHLFWKSWKRDKHSKTHGAGKTLGLDFSSPATQQDKWRNVCLSIWQCNLCTAQYCSEFKLTLAKMARWESKSNPDMRLMLYISSINTQKYYMQERYMKAVSETASDVSTHSRV